MIPSHCYTHLLPVLLRLLPFALLPPLQGNPTLLVTWQAEHRSSVPPLSSRRSRSFSPPSPPRCSSHEGDVTKPNPHPRKSPESSLALSLSLTYTTTRRFPSYSRARSPSRSSSSTHDARSHSDYDPPTSSPSRYGSPKVTTEGHHLCVIVPLPLYLRLLIPSHRVMNALTTALRRIAILLCVIATIQESVIDAPP